MRAGGPILRQTMNDKRLVNHLPIGNTEARGLKNDGATARRRALRAAV